MFQGTVRLHSHLSLDVTDVAFVEKAINESATMLDDVDDKLNTLKAFLDNMKSQPPWMQGQTVMSLMGGVSVLEALDKTLVEFGENMSTASFDWVSDAFGDQGINNVDTLHDIANVFRGLQKIQDSFSNYSSFNGATNRMASSAAKASKIVVKSDALVNGIASIGEVPLWKMGNASLHMMKESLDKFKNGKKDFDEGVKLWDETLTEMKASSFSNVDTAKLSEAASQLREDALNVFESFDNHFEQAFNELPRTKEHIANAAIDTGV